MGSWVLAGSVFRSELISAKRINRWRELKDALLAVIIILVPS